MLIPYQWLYRLRFTPWERRDVAATWQPILESLTPGRALDVGCGSGPDAVYLAQQGWKVTGVDAVATALEEAKERAIIDEVEVDWVLGDVANLGGLGLEPGYSLIYDFGCTQGLSDAARAGAVAGMTQLAAPGATALVLAFRARQRAFLPRGMDREEIERLFSEWELSSEEAIEGDPPWPVRRAAPKLYRLTRK